jgi:glutamine synthetase
MHADHMAVYGNDNSLRMTGGCETSKMDEFSFGIGDRSASIRIPTETGSKGYGYLEDRRPSSSADPYLVTSIILSSSMGGF